MAGQSKEEWERPGSGVILDTRHPGETTFGSLGRSLAKAIEVKDVYTAYHCQRVSSFATALANRLGISNVDQLAMAAQLHDIGKIAVSETILLKRGPLSEEEWAVMRAHPVVASRILSSLGFSWYIISAVRHHHEKWDGTGYPNGLAASAIPIGARVLALADAFDAMTSDRPFRKAYSFREAIQKIEINLGTQFDPFLGEAFVGLLEGNSSV